MYISAFRLRDYKSYLETDELELKGGINLVVGENDAGKSALLEGLSLSFEDIPHRDSRLKLPANDRRNQESHTIVSFTIDNAELLDILRETLGEFFIPVPAASELVENDRPNEMAKDVDRGRRFVEDLLKRPSFTFQVRCFPRRKPALVHVATRDYGKEMPNFPSLRECGTDFGRLDRRRYLTCKLDRTEKLILDREDEFLADEFTVGRPPFDFKEAEIKEGWQDSQDFGLNVCNTLQKRVYLFHAQRTAQGTCQQDYSEELRPDASNLAAFLDFLNRTPLLLRRVNEHLRTILPQIHEAAVRNLPPPYSPGMASKNGFHEIVVYQKESGHASDAIPLSACGTGVAQVLAILSLVVSAKHPCTLLIDEPQSFLHPGAVRKLLDILKRYPHQYVISTHSSQVIASADPSTITLVSKGQGEPTKLRTIDPTDQSDLTLCLQSLGARFSDVFGADRVLWVEGDTEWQCFPVIVEKLLKRPLLGTAIVPINETGGLQGKNAEQAIKAYERLSKGAALIPPTLGFVFDRENKTQPQIEELKRRLVGNNRDSIKFLKRRMIENYFLNADALTSLMLTLEGFDQERVSDSEITKWLNGRLEPHLMSREEKKKYYPATIGRGTPIETVHAARVLENLFSEFSAAAQQYDKVRHGRWLTEWLTEHRPSELDDLKNMLEEFMNRVDQIERESL